MLIHAMLHWPDIITESLWPFAVQLAVDLHNATPGTSGLSPLEIFSGTKGNHHCSNFHPFGCPAFVLDIKYHVGSQDLASASTLDTLLIMPYPSPLVYSTTTGLVSPQYHVVFDDKFSTMNCLHTNDIPSNWPDLFNSSTISYVDSDFSNTFIIVYPLPTRLLHPYLITGSSFLPNILLNLLL